jgi:hypothetical protein
MLCGIICEVFKRIIIFSIQSVYLIEMIAKVKSCPTKSVFFLQAEKVY